MDPRITFTRSTTATFTGSNGLLQTAAINAPRFDYDPVTLAPLGLLIEEQRTNLLTYSEQFDNAAWVKNASAVTVNAVVSPNGTQNADILIADATTAEHVLDQSFTVTAGTTYTFSAHVKANGLTDVGLRFTVASLWAGGTSPQVRFDLTNGTASVVTGTPSSSIQSLGNGWYRVSMSVACTTSGTSGARLQLMSGLNNVFAGNGYSGINTWGAQLEAGAFPTSYIPTVASQVTRAADVAVMTGTNFSSWYNQAEGTLYAEGDAGGGTLPCFASIDDGTTGNRIQLRRSVNDTQTGFRMVSPGGSIDVTLISGTATSVNKQAASFSAGDQNAAANGALFTGITSIPTMPTVTRMDIGTGVGSTTLNGHIRKIAYYPRRLSNAALQGITS